MAVPNSGPPLLLDHTCPHAPSAVGATRIMPACANLELCKLPNRPLGEKDGHGCRHGCGGRLHRICGEAEEEGGREIHRVCNPCIAKKQKTPDSPNQPKRASPNSGLVGDGAAAKKKKATGKGGKRTRLNFGQQLEVLKLFDNKTTYAEIQRRFGISSSAISLIKGKRQQLEKEAATNARSTTSKSSRKGEFPELEKDVLALIEEARRVPPPVTRATIESFGIAVRDKLVAAPSTPAEAKERLRMFGASEKWVRNFLTRHNLSSIVLHGEAGRLDAEAAAEGMEAIRRACSKFKVENIFNVDETGVYYRLLPKRTYLSRTEKRKTARGTKGMKAKDSESAGGGGKKAPPSFAELAELFGPLEQYAESCGIGEAGHHLRKAKMLFFAAHSARPARQMDIRTFADS